MSTQIMEAIQLANAGQRDAARNLLRQVVTVETGNEMAWLWLASVAEDQAEYRMALKEVLRINPANDQAKVLLAQVTPVPPAPAPAEGMTYVPQSPPRGTVMPQQPVSPPWGVQQPQSPPYGVQQQPISPPQGVPQSPPYGVPQQPQSPPYGVQQQPQSPPYGVPQQPVSPPYGVQQQPQSPPYGVPQQPVSPPYGVQQQPVSPPYGVQQQPQSPPYGVPQQQRVMSAYVPQAAVAAQPRQRSVRARSCLLMLVVFVVLPLGIFLGLCYSGKSLGSLDLIGSYLPGDFGRKTISFELPAETGSAQAVTVKVPRSWYVAHNKDTWWDAWQGLLDDYVKFEAGYGPFEDSWADVEASYDTATVDRGVVFILETNPLNLKSDGAPTLLIYIGMRSIAEGSAQCSEMSEPSARSGIELVKMHDGLCAVQRTRTDEYMGDGILESSDAPDQFYTLFLDIPVDDHTETRWRMIVPADRYEGLTGDIEALIQSVTVE